MSPLHDITVVDFSELLPGPFLTQSLAELGANVIKVERPPHGDAARRMAPGIFGAVNRGKHTVQANLKADEDRKRVLELVKIADVLIEGYRPGVMARLGLDYETVKALNPSIIYVSLTGYGQTGKRAMLPGHDVNYQAASGALALSGLPDGRPQHVYGLPVADLCGALYGLSALLAALFQRERSQQGQWLDVALADCLKHWINPRVGAFHAEGVADLAHQRKDALDKPAYGVFPTADGRDITIGALEDHFWAALCGVLDLAPFDTPEFAGYSARAARASDIRVAIATQTALWPCDELEHALQDADVPVVPVQSPDQVLASELLDERGLRTEGQHGPLVRFPVRLSGMDDAPLFPTPIPLEMREDGLHSDSSLKESAGS